MGLIHKNVGKSKDDTEYGEKLIALTPVKAFEKLMSGVEVFAKFKTFETTYEKGCKKCKVAMKKGNFCSNCGSKLTNKLPIERVKDVVWLGLSMRENEDGTNTLMETSSHPHSNGWSYRESSIHLSYFANTKIWYWRGY